jgi:hypothetical protein
MEQKATSVDVRLMIVSKISKGLTLTVLVKV